MRIRSYQPVTDVQKNGNPIIAVCGGVEAVVCWDDPYPGLVTPGWFYWDEEELGPSHERVRGEVTLWRPLY